MSAADELRTAAERLERRWQWDGKKRAAQDRTVAALLRAHAEDYDDLTPDDQTWAVRYDAPLKAALAVARAVSGEPS